MTETQRLHVLFVTPWYPYPDSPTSGIFVREHARAVQRYHDVTVLHTIGATEGLSASYTLQRDTFNDVPNQADEMQIPTYVMRYRKSILPGTDRLWRHKAMYRALSTVIDEMFIPDIIHAHIHRAALPSLMFGHKHKLPVVVTEQHSAFPLRSLNRFDILEAKIAFKRAKTVMPVSKALQSSIQEHDIQANFQIVPNVVDTALFMQNGESQSVQKSDDSPIRLLCVAGMPVTHVKGFPYLFDALAQLEDQYNWRLDIIGDGPMMSEYVTRVQELGLSDKITFYGFQTKHEIVKAMNRADIFVLASVWDSMPCVIIEAMSVGLPVVATRTGGIPEMVTDECGLLAEPGDVLSLQTTLSEMFDTYTHFSAERIRASAQKSYSYEAVGAQLDKVYKRVVAKQKAK